MALITARAVSLLLGVFMIYFVLSGGMRSPMFYWPDLSMGVLLLLSAIAPFYLALRMLPISGAFALGVYAVALASQLQEAQPIGPLLLIGIVASAAIIVLASAASSVALMFDRRGSG